MNRFNTGNIRQDIELCVNRNPDHLMWDAVRIPVLSCMGSRLRSYMLTGATPLKFQSKMGVRDIHRERVKKL